MNAELLFLTGLLSGTVGGAMGIALMSASLPWGLALTAASIAVATVAIKIAMVPNDTYHKRSRGESRHPFFRRAAIRLGLVGEADCGCLYTLGTYNPSPPGRERVSSADGGESEYIWEATQKGAKVTWRLSEEYLARCSYCGRHCYERTKVKHTCSAPVDTTRITVWEDDPLPDTIAEMDAQIEEVA